MKGNKLIDDHVQITVNIARYKSHGKLFEIVIDPDKVVAFKEGDALDVDECLKAETIFSDAKKGEVATEADLMSVFDTIDVQTVAKTILSNGEIQFTQKYRQNLREQKYNKVITLIHRYAMNPKTGLLHPQTRLRAAMQEASVRINDFKKPEDQLDEIIKQLRPIIPISMEKKELRIYVPAAVAAKVHGPMLKFGKIVDEKWGSDGALTVCLQLPIGLMHDCVAELQSLTHGACELLDK